MTNAIVIFDGREGSERVRVWVQAYGDGIALMSHDIGPGVERFFGKDDIETFLVVDGSQLSAPLPHSSLPRPKQGWSRMDRFKRGPSAC